MIDKNVNDNGNLGHSSLNIKLEGSHNTIEVHNRFNQNRRSDGLPQNQVIDSASQQAPKPNVNRTTLSFNTQDEDLSYEIPFRETYRSNAPRNIRPITIGGEGSQSAQPVPSQIINEQIPIAMAEPVYTYEYDKEVAGTTQRLQDVEDRAIKERLRKEREEDDRQIQIQKASEESQAEMEKKIIAKPIRGRPKGAKDVTPRKKKVEEPIRKKGGLIIEEDTEEESKQEVESKQEMINRLFGGF